MTTKQQASRFECRDRKYWEMARDLLADSFAGNRVIGASLLEILKWNTEDEETLRLLAPVVANTRERATVRKSAYAAMWGILHNEPTTNVPILLSPYGK